MGVDRRRKPTIALLYHYVPKKADDQHALVDNQTDEIVQYLHRIFKRRGYRVRVVTVTPHDLSKLTRLKTDFIFNLVDSKALEIKVARILERLGIPYSGSSARAIRISNDKPRAKQLFEQHHLPTPRYTVIRPRDRLSKRSVPGKFPIIVKPAFEHCSIGITNRSIARNYRQFRTAVQALRRTHHRTLLAEEFITGRELQVTVLETPSETVALPIAEIAFRGKVRNRWNIYGFDEKWGKHLPIYHSCHFVAPPRPRLKEAIDAQIKQDTIRAFDAFGFRDYARFDLRYHPRTQRWYFLEGNANAGFDPHPRDAMTVSIKANGMTIGDFAAQIVKNSAR